MRVFCLDEQRTRTWSFSVIPDRPVPAYREAAHE